MFVIENSRYSSSAAKALIPAGTEDTIIPNDVSNAINLLLLIINHLINKYYSPD